MGKTLGQAITEKLAAMDVSAVAHEAYQDGYNHGVRDTEKRLRDQLCGGCSVGTCRCGGDEVDEHTCPYAEDINDDHETLCRCCPKCQQDCADDI